MMKDPEEKEQTTEGKEAQDELDRDAMEEIEEIEIEDLTVDGICGVY